MVCNVAHLNHVVKLDDVDVGDAAQDGNLALKALLELATEARGVDLFDSHRLAGNPVLRLPDHCKGSLAYLVAQHVVIANDRARRGWDVHAGETLRTECLQSL